MSERAHISDEDLVAYLDGFTSQEQGGSIERALKQDPNLRARFDVLRHGERPFLRAYDRLLERAPVDRLAHLAGLPDARPPATDNPPMRYGSFTQIALMFLAVTFGGVATYLAMQYTQQRANPEIAVRDDTWRQAVAEYQVLYTRQTLNAVKLSPRQLERSFARLSGALGMEVSPAKLNVAGLYLKRGQVLGWKGQPLVQIAFLPRAKGNPIAFCITRSPGKDQAPRAEQRLGLNVSHWRKNGFGLMVIGEQSPEEINRIAAALFDRLS